MNQDLLFKVFVAGFKASREGHNFEYPYFKGQDHGHETKMLEELLVKFEEFLKQQG